jgi:hypothetical protein
VSGESVPEQHALQVWVAIKVDAHEIVNLTLLQISTSPDVIKRWDCGLPAALDAGFEHEAMVEVDGSNVVDKLKVVDVVYSGHGGEVAEVQPRFFFQKLSHPKKVFAPYDDIFGSGFNNSLWKALTNLLGHF